MGAGCGDRKRTGRWLAEYRAVEYNGGPMAVVSTAEQVTDHEQGGR